MGLNSVTASPNENGKVTLNLSPEQDDPTNYVYIMDGWNYVLRQYFPKGTNMSLLTQEELDQAAYSLNTRPRHTLGGMTPSDKLAETMQ